MNATSRREFLVGAGKSVGFAAVGFAAAERLGFAEWLRPLAPERLRFGALDPLVDMLQETPADALLPLVVKRLRGGTPLTDLVGAAALANARAYGGTNYNGYHTLMAMVPSFEMAAQMPAPYGALPVIKVLHRNARFLQETGKAKEDTLEPLPPVDKPAGLVESVRAREVLPAEQSLASGKRSETETYELLQTVVRDDMNVHRIVLAWRAHDLSRLTGAGHSVTLLRQCVRFCIDEDARRLHMGQPANEIVALLPKLMEQHRLEGRERGMRVADEAWIEKLADTIFSADRPAAAAAAAAALAEGFNPEDVGAAMSLAAARLLLNDPGLKQEVPGRPVGSVHGASVGVHASDAANAWRHVARVGSARNAFASLIAGAFHTAGQSSLVGAQPFDHEGEPNRMEDPVGLLREIEGKIRDRNQAAACLAARRYCELGHPPVKLFELLLGFAVSQDGALHAEKYFRTAQEEHSMALAPHRPLYLVALSRVMASHFGFPAPGYEEARKLLAG